MGDSAHYDWLNSNNPEERSTSTKYFVLPTFTLTSTTDTLIDATDISNAGSPKLSAYYRGNEPIETPIYNEDSNDIYVWFIVPAGHAPDGATIYQNSDFGYQPVDTISAGDVVIGGGSHVFTYKAFRTEN